MVMFLVFSMAGVCGDTFQLVIGDEAGGQTAYSMQGQHLKENYPVMPITGRLRNPGSPELTCCSDLE